MSWILFYCYKSKFSIGRNAHNFHCCLPVCNGSSSVLQVIDRNCNSFVPALQGEARGNRCQVLWSTNTTVPHQGYQHWRNDTNQKVSINTLTVLYNMYNNTIGPMNNFSWLFKGTIEFYLYFGLMFSCQQWSSRCQTTQTEEFQEEGEAEAKVCTPWRMRTVRWRCCNNR